MSTEWERARPPLKRITSPAWPGNDLALRHGAYSERAIIERAEQVHRQIVAVAPWLDEDRYMPALAAYLRAASREQLAQTAIEAWDGKGRFPTRLVETATAAARLAWQMGDELGLTPAGHAKLKSLMADAVGAEVTVAEMVERGRAARLAAEAARSVAQPSEPPVGPDDPKDAA